MKSLISKYSADKRSFSTRREKENSKVLKTPKERAAMSNLHIKTISPSNITNSQLSDGLLNCNICLDCYNDTDKKPKILPHCGHTLCQECLKSLISTSKDNKKLICHLCKKENPIFTNMSVDKYPNNWIIIDIIKNSVDISEFGIANSNSSMSTVCRACNKNEVSHFCRLHFIKYCAYCALKHMKECRPEKMIELNEIDTLADKIKQKTTEIDAKIISRLNEIDEYKAVMEKSVEDKFNHVINYLTEKRKNTLATLDYQMFQLASLKEESKVLLKDLNTSHAPLNELINSPDLTALKAVSKTVNSAEEFINCNKQKVEEMPIVKILFNEESLSKLVEEIKSLCWVELQTATSKEIFNPLVVFLNSCEKGNVRLVDFLLKNFSLNIETKDKNGYTPAFLALICKHINLFKFLREQYNADIDVQDNTGKNPLIFAAMTCNESLAEYLLVTCHAKPNFQTIWKDTALHFAAQSGSKVIVKLLLQHYADTSILNGEGKLAIQLSKIPEIADLIKSVPPTQI